MSEQPLRFAVFHVAHRRNRAPIREEGLLSRRRLKKKRARFVDIADKALRDDLFREQTVRCILPGGKLESRTIVLADFVQCHFVKPLSRWYVVPRDVYRWQQERVPLDVWVIRREFLERSPHAVCLGHWAATWFGGPVILDSLRLFSQFLERPSRIPATVRREHPWVKTFFTVDLPNILRGRVNTAWLGQPGNRYGHLMHSTVLIPDRIPGKYIEMATLESLEDIDDDHVFTVR